MTVTRNKAAVEGETPPRTSSADHIYRFLSSLRFTMLVLSFIALACIAGTLIKQQAPPQEYLARYSEATYTTLRFLGLTDVFHSPWFLLLTGLFVLNLVFCTAGRLSHFLKNRKEVRIPTEKALVSMSPGFMVPGARMAEVAGLFKGYRKAAGGDTEMALEKGNVSRYGVYIIHTSIVVILIGSVIGLMFGYRGFITLNKGESRDSVNPRGPAQGPTPLGFMIKCDDFKVSFYPTGEPKDYVSSVRILDGGKPVKQGEVRVNHPLTYKGTSIYQASYGSDPSFLFNIAGQDVKLSQGGVYKKEGLTVMVVRFEKSVHNFGPGVQIAYLDGNESKTSWFLKDVARLREKEINGVRLQLKDIAEEYYTGLEISRDPGVWVVWTGFAMILFGLYVTFFMYYRKVYLLQTTKGVLVAGISARNKEAFRQEFEKWRERADGLKR
jgi:cytochrome c biogenesis protein